MRNQTRRSRGRLRSNIPGILDRLDIPARDGQAPIQMTSHHPCRFRPCGLSTLEILVILLVVTTGLFTAWLAAEKWKHGKDRNECLMNIRNAQTAMRSYQGLNQLATGDELDWKDLFLGPGRMMHYMPACPGGGTYHFANQATAPGVLYMTCSLAKSHNHQPATPKGW